MRGRQPAECAAPELMLTPLVDVILMLLTFFLLGTNFKQVQGVLEALLPKAGGPAAKPDLSKTPMEELVIRAMMLPGHKAPIYRLGTVDYPNVKSLEDRLFALRDARLKQSVTIDPDRTAPFEPVLWVLNSCVKVGYTDVAFAAQMSHWPIPSENTQ